MQCYGTGSCCNFYDENDICLQECNAEMNFEANENYTCTCQGYYGPPGNCSSELNT